jgi:hypothetical protein
VIPANPGVNPSLTTTALAEHAMTFVPGSDGAVERSAPAREEDVVEPKDRGQGQLAGHEMGEPARPST